MSGHSGQRFRPSEPGTIDCRKSEMNNKVYHTVGYWLSVTIVVVNVFMLTVVSRVPRLRPLGMIFILSALSGFIGALSHWHKSNRKK